MRILGVAMSELRVRAGTALISTAAVLVAAGVLVGQITFVRVQEAKTDAFLQLKESQTRREIERFQSALQRMVAEHGYNLVVLSSAQDRHEYLDLGVASQTMSETSAEELAAAKIRGLGNLVPVLERRIRWPEAHNRTVYVAGVGDTPVAGDAAAVGNGERLIDGSGADVHPRPKPGHVVLGSELWRSMGVAAGDTVRLLGSPFTVATCRSQQGSREDITVRLDLADAQRLLSFSGRISAIYALHTGDPDEAVEIIARRFPSLQTVVLENAASTMRAAVERGAEAARRAFEEERVHRAASLARERRLSRAVAASAIVVGLGLTLLLSILDVRRRRREIGILRAVGWRSRQVGLLILTKQALIGLVGAVAGVVAGAAVGLAAVGGSHGLSVAAAAAEGAGAARVLPVGLMAAVVLLSPVATVGVSSIPVLRAIRSDPALVIGRG